MSKSIPQISEKTHIPKTTLTRWLKSDLREQCEPYKHMRGNRAYYDDEVIDIIIKYKGSDDSPMADTSNATRDEADSNGPPVESMETANQAILNQKIIKNYIAQLENKDIMIADLMRQLEDERVKSRELAEKCAIIADQAQKLQAMTQSQLQQQPEKKKGILSRLLRKK